MYTLHGYWRSSATYRVRCALELKGIPYAVATVSLIADGGQQNTESYRALNPLAEVPTLMVDDVPIAQSVAILELLEELHPEVPLLPSTPLDRARVRQLVEAVNSGIHPLQNMKVQKHMTAHYGHDTAANEAWCRHWIARGFVGLDELVGRWCGRHAFGDAPTLADCLIVPQIYNARRYHVDMAAFPRLQAVWDAALALPAFQRAAPEAQLDAPRV